MILGLLRYYGRSCHIPALINTGEDNYYIFANDTLEDCFGMKAVLSAYLHIKRPKVKYLLTISKDLSPIYTVRLK